MVASIKQITDELNRSGLIRAKRAVKADKELELAVDMAKRAVDRKAKAEALIEKNEKELSERITPLAAVSGEDVDAVRERLMTAAREALAAGDDTETEGTDESAPAGEVQDTDDSGNHVAEVTAETETAEVESDPEVMAAVAEARGETETEDAKPRSRRGRFAKAE